jgi:6-phosphogluconate dehydrogenase
MQLGMIGLGRMGGNMTERLMKDGHSMVVYDRWDEAVKKYEAMGATPSRDLKDLCSKLSSPKIVWIMVGPAGKVVIDTVNEVASHLSPGDIIIEGGNSNYKNSQQLARELSAKGIEFIDSGTSGGVWGLKNGYCLMIGGSDKAVETCAPIFKTLAPENGWAHVGPAGAGHFVKTIHNGIEYGLLQAYAEGYEILHASKDYKFDLYKIAKLWNQGSVVRSWLNELAELAFKADPNLDALKGYVEDSGMGRWTVQEALDLNVPAPVLTLSLLTRFRSRQADSFSGKVVAALRNQFGGHAVKKV